MVNKKLYLTTGIVISLLLVGSFFLIYDNKKVSFVEEKLNNFEMYDNFVILQPSYYFTAEEYPYGNEGIYVKDNELTIKTNQDMDDLSIARASGTGSMLPTIPRNALLIEIPIVESELMVGDIVSIKQDDYNIIHRIVNITEEGYITKGDNNDVVDPEVWQIDDLERKLVGVLW